MKKLSVIIAILLMVLFVCACAKKEDFKTDVVTGPATEAETTEAAPAEDETKGTMVGMPNPMKQVDADVTFATELGIYIDAHKLPSYPTNMFIIADKLADVRFELENVDGDKIEYTLRATKDEGESEMMHGIFDQNMTDVREFNCEMDSDSTDVKERFAETEKTDIYTWKWNDTFFSFTYSGSVSQMQLSEILDSVFFAIGMGTDHNWYTLSDDNQVITFNFIEKDNEEYEFEISDDKVIESLTFEHTGDDPDYKSNIGEFAGSFKAFNGAGEAEIKFTAGKKMRAVQIKVDDNNALEVVSEKQDN